MGDETGMMNLDLNLGPLVPSSPGREPGSHADLVLVDSRSPDDWVEEPEQPPLHRRFSAAGRQRSRQRWRRQQVHMLPETRSISMELMGNSGDVNGTPTGEGSVASEERPDEHIKTCENNNGDFGDEALGKREEVEKGCSGDGSFFDCNICLDLASEPVVTCCGHLFCWACLYRWLHIHSNSKECPVCKGEVTVKHVTPIFGRGSDTRAQEEGLDPGIPIRPPAQRVESFRQSILRDSFSSVEEMFRRLGGRFMARDSELPQDPDGERDTQERSHALFHHMLTARGRRMEQNLVSPPVDVGDLNQSRANAPLSLLLRRPQPYRVVPYMGDAYFRTHPLGRHPEPAPPIDDRDSFSSIGAVIHSGSQTVDTAVEIDSTVSLSTSSSRRRNDVSRASDVDSGDSRAPRRRRLS